MGKLLRYIKPHWKAAILAPLLMVLEVYMDLLQPKLMGSIINDGVMKGDLVHIQKTGALMLLVAFVGLLGGIGCTIFSSIAAQNFGSDLREDIFQKIQTFSFRNLDHFKAGSLLTRLTGDVTGMQTFMQMALRSFVRAPLLAVGSVTMALSISPSLALILIVSIPILFGVLYGLTRLSFPLFSIVQRKLDTVNTVLQENLSGIRVVKAFVRSPFERRRFASANEQYRAAAVKAARMVARNIPIMTLILNIVLVTVLWFGGVQTRNGSLAPGDLAAFLTYVTQLLFSLLMIGRLMPLISSAKASAERIQEVFDTNPEITECETADTPSIHSGRVVFEHVSLSYDEQQKEWALSGITLAAEPGQTVAIIGATGAGKTSLVSLLPRLYDPTAGRVLIDGIDIQSIPLAYVRSRIGMVLQQAILFSGTIRDNICFGKPDASQVEVEAAAMAADIHDFIMTLPDRYDTMLGQRGINLSGGQKQRISLARTFLLRPAILILDDSTSAVDFKTESRIQQALRQLMDTCTTFVIAQRISSVAGADKIIVIEEGRIAAEGTHAELLAGSRIYQEIYASQQGKEVVVYDKQA